MSGRLIITTKKTYCPWNPQNVERVLRDERLERERLEREEKAVADVVVGSRRRRKAGDGGGDDDDANGIDGEDATQERGHMNLFPEAKEAELRLAQGRGSTKNGSDDKKNGVGVLPVTLGGEEASNRKAGNVPFYFQSTAKTNHEANAPEQDQYYGRDARVLGRRVDADAITGKIMSDQLRSREDSRKSRMDPMSRFYATGQCQSNSAVQNESGVGELCMHDDSDCKQSTMETGQHQRERSSHRNRKDFKKKRRRHGSSDSDSSDESSSSSSSSRRHHRSKRSHRKLSRSHHSREREDRHSKRRSSRKDKKRRQLGKPSDTERDTASTSNVPHHNSQQHDAELENLRRRRQAREARESERERQMMKQGDSGDNNDKTRGYHNQFSTVLKWK